MSWKKKTLIKTVTNKNTRFKNMCFFKLLSNVLSSLKSPVQFVREWMQYQSLQV